MKYLIIIVICFFIASICSLAGVFVLQYTGVIGNADTDFKNLPYGIAIAYNLYLSIGTLPILLNLNDRIRFNTLFSALSFFLLPGIFVLFSLLLMWDEPWPGVLFCFPYIVALIFSFICFRKTLELQNAL